MKRLLCAGIGIAAAAVVAVPAWLARDDGGPRRAASLPVGSTEWRLTIQGVNDGNPMPIESFSWGVKRPVGTGQAQHEGLRVVRDADDISSELLSRDATAVPADWAKLELVDAVSGTPTVVWRYDLTKVTLDYGQSAQGAERAREPIVLHYETISSFAHKDIALGFVGDVAVMFSQDPTMQAVKLGSLWFGGADVSGGKLSFPPLKITRPLDAHAAQFERKAVDGKIVPSIRIELRQPGTGGQAYAMYELTNVAVVSAASSGQKLGAAQAVQSLELAPARLKTTSYREDPNTGQYVVSKTFCWDVALNKACPA